MKKKTTAKWVVVAYAIMLTAAAVNAFGAVSDHQVSVTPDTFTPAESLDVSAMLSTSSDLIRLNEAHTTYSNIDGRGYTIAVIDTGVDYTHPALAGRYVGGWDFVNNDANPDDDNGHGTHVTGITTSSNSTYTGIAPGANYVGLKVLDANGSGSFSNIEKSLQWVLQNREKYNITAVNLSLGTSSVYQSPISTYLTDEFQALKNAGVFTAVAAGNGYADHDDTGGGVNYPASDPYTVTVGSVWSGDFGSAYWSSGAIDYSTAADRVVSHSDRHSDLLDILAPGAWITSASSNWETGGDWVAYGGTSMATPMVAGMSVLIRQAIEEHWADGDLPQGAEWQDTILSIMKQTGADVFDGDDEHDNVINLNQWFKRIDVAAALHSTVPEPGSVMLILLGGGLLLARRRRRGVE